MTTVAVIGLGYVGLPLAVEFGKRFDTVGCRRSAGSAGTNRSPSGPGVPAAIGSPPGRGHPTRRHPMPTVPPTSWNAMRCAS